MLVITALTLLAPLPVLALGVNPGELNFVVDPGQQCSRTLDVINDEDNEVVYKIYVDDEHESWFSISPDEISLAPQQSGEIEITVSPPLTTIGEHTAFVYITSAQPSSGLQVALGIKLKANITIDVVGYGLSILQDNLPYLIIGVLGIVTLVIFIFVVIRPKIRRY
jgi:P pilus assembly chaperone PapD